MWERLDPGPVISLIGTLLTGVMTALVTWRVARGSERKDSQKAITDGFNSLILTMQTDRKELIGEIKELQKENLQQRGYIRALEDEVRKLGNQLVRFERILMQHGIDIPPVETTPNAPRV